MTSIKRLRGVGIASLVLVVASFGAPPTWAAGADPAEDGGKKAAAQAVDDEAAKPATPPPAATPQMGLDDEGPSTRVAKKIRHGMQAPPPDDTDEKPFWKTWIFWTVTGALVAGAVGAVIYSTSGTRGSVGPCPAGVALSLGCYGAGRM
jgi:hypothetical protein